MIRTREELLGTIYGSRHLSELFFSWKEEQQQEFLDFCTGVRVQLSRYQIYLCNCPLRKKPQRGS